MNRQYLTRALGKVRHVRREILMSSRSLRNRGAMPNFIIVGAQKAATTSLYDALMREPEFRPSYLKEIHYFDAFYHKGLAWYQAHFPDSDGHSVSGEASPSYLLHPLASKRIHETIGRVLIIILLRNPVDRAISHYWHEVANGRERRPPEEALLADESDVISRLKRLEATGTGWGNYLMRRSYKTRGVYLPQLRRFIEVFGHEAVHLIGFRDFVSAPQDVIHGIRERLGLPGPTTKTEPVHHNRRRVNQPLSDDVRTELERFFSEPNEKLRDFLGALPDW